MNNHWKIYVNIYEITPGNGNWTGIIPVTKNYNHFPVVETFYAFRRDVLIKRLYEEQIIIKKITNPMERTFNNAKKETYRSSSSP